MASLDSESEFYGTSCLNGCNRCKFRQEDDAVIFRIVDIQSQIVGGRVDIIYDSLLFVVSGEITVSLNSSDKETSLSSGTIFRLNSGDVLLYRVMTNVKIISLHFTTELISRSKDMFRDFAIVDTAMFHNALSNMRSLPMDSIYNIKMNSTLDKYIQLFDDYVSGGCACSVYLNLKLKELYMLILHYYSLNDVICMLSPILLGENSFRRFVLRNYTKVNNVNQLIEMSCMSKSLFYTRFKQEFGVTAKQWLMERMNERICNLFRQPNSSISYVMKQLNFTSQSNFSRYCVTQLGCTPRELLFRYGTTA